MPRSHTKDECRQIFLDTVRAYAQYWADLPDKTPLERCNGLAFSIMVILDGGSCDLPAFKVIPSPHPSDKKYDLESGKNWWPKNEVDIAGQLHELLYKKED